MWYYLNNLAVLPVSSSKATSGLACIKAQRDTQKSVSITWRPSGLQNDARNGVDLSDIEPV